MKQKIIASILTACLLANITCATSVAADTSEASEAVETMTLAEMAEPSETETLSDILTSSGTPEPADTTIPPEASDPADTTIPPETSDPAGTTAPPENTNSADTATPPKSSEPAVIPAISPATSKASSKSIKISWSSSQDASVKYYYVMRRNTKNSKGTGAWKTRAQVKSDGVKGGPLNLYTDKLSTSKAQQYEYKICTLSADETLDTRDPAYAAKTDGYAVLGTNIRVCIDPGHYGSRNNNYKYSASSGNGKYRYSEAKFTLKIGKALQTALKKTYGIDSFMNRTSSSISLTYNGKKYSNAGLDQRNIAIRGYSAKTNNCDFFISLHTNATNRKTKPWNQSKKINKVLVFTNKVALKSARGMKIANSIGVNLTAYNKKVKIQTAGFTTRTKNHAKTYSDRINNSSNAKGTVIFRKNTQGTDYYGVLRGSSAKGIEGIIVEHAFHATQVVRKKAAASSALYKNWAACDAYGIAYGFGFMNSQKLK